MDNCDILLLQEHWYFDADLHKIAGQCDNVTVYGASGMDSSLMLYGRPFGGCAFVFRNFLKCSVTRIASSCKRLIALIVEIAGARIMMINVYMPCDTVYDVAVADMYNDVLNEIELIVDSHPQVDCVIIGGDLNVDFERNSLNKQSLLSMCDRQCLRSGLRSHVASVDFTYMNEATGSGSIIDHFLLTEDLFQKISAYSSLHRLRELELKIKIDNTLTKTVTVCKYLGVYIDQKLSWADHIQHVCIKTSRSIGIMNKVSKFLDEKTIQLQYSSLVLPYLNYGNIIWGRAAATHLSRAATSLTEACRENS
ncbi:hypothetical protein CAPTEDRAFT_209336 [Capitella teleta]|uniref:Endonuclease/exonuclease/phosphatase domain-containing protein n=1 Tax=Capitella teleta TaxID=283909 RepID=R7TEU7_CAPTE|nr:hypothetical protein CAPTEDRAFT_209336 [Capitella teleta]|eukprot:ELT92012.1 hypothetical protein CAPTEDRAFT_209336 [Capitella teleta]